MIRCFLNDIITTRDGATAHAVNKNTNDILREKYSNQGAKPKLVLWRNGIMYNVLCDNTTTIL